MPHIAVRSEWEIGRDWEGEEAVERVRLKVVRACCRWKASGAVGVV